MPLQGRKEKFTLVVFMAEEYDFSYDVGTLGDYYRAHKAEVDLIVPKCEEIMKNANKHYYTELKAWFHEASKIDSKAQGATHLLKCITSFVLLLQKNGKSWSPPSVCGIEVPDIIRAAMHPRGIEVSEDDVEGGADEAIPAANPAAAISVRELSTIMAQMEDRIIKKVARSFHQGGQQGQRQQQSAMTRILAENPDAEEDYAGECLPKHAAMEDNVDVDDPDILYFPLLWLEKAQFNTAEMRQLMHTLREATRIRNPKHKAEQYQVDHLLQVAHLIFKGKHEEACEQIGYRIHFLLKSTTRHLGEAIDYYEHLVKAKRPQKEREADIMSKIPKSMGSKQASFLGQQIAGKSGKGDHDKTGQHGAGAGQQGAGAGSHGAGDAQRQGGGRRGRPWG